MHQMIRDPSRAHLAEDFLQLSKNPASASSSQFQLSRSSPPLEDEVDMESLIPSSKTARRKAPKATRSRATLKKPSTSSSFRPRSAPVKRSSTQNRSKSIASKRSGKKGSTSRRNRAQPHSSRDRGKDQYESLVHKLNSTYPGSVPFLLGKVQGIIV